MKWLSSLAGVAFCISIIIASIPSVHERLHECPDAAVHETRSEGNHQDDRDHRPSDRDSICFLCSFNQGQFTMVAQDAVFAHDLPVLSYTRFISEESLPELTIYSTYGRAPPLVF